MQAILFEGTVGLDDVLSNDLIQQVPIATTRFVAWYVSSSGRPAATRSNREKRIGKNSAALDSR